MDKQQQQQSGRREKNLNSFIHTLPKANQIFQVLQHVKKSIYPFQMKTNTHQFLQRPIEPYVREGGGEGKSGGDGRGKPVFQSVEEYFAGQGVVYDKFNNNADQQLFNQNIYPLSKLKNLKNLDYMTQIPYTQPLTHPDPTLLHFNSRFESGNLSLAALHSETYYLLLHNDVNTSGYTSWFYFQVRAPRKGRYRFVILNYGKAGLMHREGVRICVYGGGAEGTGGGWRRGGERIWCQGNAGLYRKGMYTGFNSLGFQYQFLEDNSQVYFSYNVPYTYNDLCCFLDEIEQKKYPYFNRKLAGISLAGNRLQAITITNFSLLAQGHDLPVIILMARSHPGETVSSWIMHEYIKFLLSDTPEAVSLRNNFIFKLFPMINPDGVIHGNYRCSLSGRDLNRRWNQTNKELFPEVYFIRNQIVEISRRKNIKMILDLHGHTKKKKIFAYGCNNKNQPHRCRLFPYILSKLSPHFQFRYCNFCISKYKYGTARISLYNELRIPYIYTIESSQFGIFQGHLNLGVFTDIAGAIGRGCLALFRVKAVLAGKGQGQGNGNEESNNEGLDNFENELLNDSSLIKIGSEKDSGSESEPSVDNIKFDKLNEMNKRRQMRYNTASKVNSQTKKPNGHQRLKSSTNTSQSLQKIRKSIPVRPKTSQGNTQKYVEEEPKNNGSFIQKRIHSMNRPFAERARSAPKTEINANQITKPLQNRRRAQALNFINLSLSIFDETKSNRSYRTGTKIDSYTDFNEGLLNKLRLAPRNYIQFRRIK